MRLKNYLHSIRQTLKDKNRTISNLKYCKGFLILVLGKGMEIYYFKPINAKNYNKQVDYFLFLLAISSNYSSFVMWLWIWHERRCPASMVNSCCCMFHDKLSLISFNIDRHNFKHFLQAFAQWRGTESYVAMKSCEAFVVNLHQKCLYRDVRPSQILHPLLQLMLHKLILCPKLSFYVFLDMKWE